MFKDAWDAAHPGTMPTLFGEEFMETLAPNRYEIPAFYALHVWLYRYNPTGLFAPFNPRVSCDPGHKPTPIRHRGVATSRQPRCSSAACRHAARRDRRHSYLTDGRTPTPRCGCVAVRVATVRSGPRSRPSARPRPVLRRVPSRHDRRCDRSRASSNPKRPSTTRPSSVERTGPIRWRTSGSASTANRRRSSPAST